MARGARTALEQLNQSLAEVGLGGQVRLGVPDSGVLPGKPVPHSPDTAQRGSGELASPLPDPRTGDVEAVDQLLRPLERPAHGQLIEVSGEPSSGRTALAYRMVAGATARGELAGWVDLPNALDPRFLRRTQADLNALLWARPDHPRAALRATELMLKAGFAVVVLDLEDSPTRPLEKLGSAAWNRLLRAVRASRSTVIILGPAPVSNATATLGLHFEKRRPVFDRGLFEGLETAATVVRNRRGPTEQTLPFRVYHRP